MVRKLDFAMMSQFFKHTMSLPYSFFAKRKTGDIFARFQENQTIRAFLTESTVTTVLNLLMVFIYFTIMFLYNVKLTLLLIAFVDPDRGADGAGDAEDQELCARVFTASTDAKSYLMEALGGAETIKGMGIERPVRLKWEKKYAKALDVQYRAQSFNILVGLRWPVAECRHHHCHPLGRGQSRAGARADHRPADRVQRLDGQRARAVDGAGGAVEPAERRRRRDGAPRRRARHRAGAEARGPGVARRAPGPDRARSGSMASTSATAASETPYVLENVSLEIKPGELVAIVGRSGSGKTTLAKLLVGFYPPTEGKLTVDGYDMSVIDKEYYRAQVGYVMQSNLLFSGTIAENIASGDESPDRRRIEEVAKMADAHAFIAKMPLRLRAGRGRARHRSCPAGRSSGCASPGRCTTIRACWCSTRRPRRSTRSPRATSSPT